jgi:hypothetical protein
MRELLVPSSSFLVGLRAWYRELRNLLSTGAEVHAGNGLDARRADTTDDGMTEMLARAIALPPTSRWERAAVRATIGLHATRQRSVGASGEQGLVLFKDILHRAMPPISVRTAEQSFVAKEMVRWWVEAYYEPDS